MIIPVDIMEQMRGTFRAEVLDLLIELDSALLELEVNAGDSTLIHRVFRAIHTIKGSGSTAGFSHLARFAHQMEEAFDLAREGRLLVTPELIDCGLKACDVIRLIIEERGEQSSEGCYAPGEPEVTSAFRLLLPTAESTPKEHPGASRAAAVFRAAFEIVFKPRREMFYSGADPVTLLDDLRDLGQAHIIAHIDQVPLLGAIEAEHCYLWWQILLVTNRDQEAIKDVFVFVEDDCEVSIRLLEDQEAAVALFGSVPADALELFALECDEHLDALERDALALEADPGSKERLDSLFRTVHSIKGNAGLLLGHVKGAALIASHPLQLLLRVTHGLESLLDRSRGASAGPVSGQTIQNALDTGDATRGLLVSLLQQGTVGPISQELLARLGIETDEPAESEAADATMHPNSAPEWRDATFFSATSQCVEMIAGCFQRMEGNAQRSGPILQTYMRGLKTLSAAARYRQCAELEEPLARQLLILDAAVRTGAALSDEHQRVLSEAFQSARSILNGLAPPEPPANSTSEGPPRVASQSPAKATPHRQESAAPPSTIRIEQNKLDRLMRVVGELLVARGAFPLLIQRLNRGEDGAGVAKDLKEAGSNISRIADELQTSIMSVRMLPVKTVFQKFPRLVRDLARSLGKEVQLIIEGEGIEMDKTILEQIADPLVHLIRNAVDHGLEVPEERVKKGKDPSGKLTLRAFYEGGGVAIEVTEDGRGLDAGSLCRKAVEKGLLSAEAASALSDEAAFQLVFLPGLTTAAKVTDVSGRGVGMDVVRSNVRNLRGTIEIRSRADHGTTFLIKLPASLMISKGILLNAGGQEYILPLSNIRDMVKLPAMEAHEFRGSTLAQVRGTIYPIYSLARMMGLVPTATTELSIAIVETGAVKYGLVVDKFLTEVEVLVKPLAGGLEECKQFQGAAIMGDGRVVLVLNALECHSLDRMACN